MRKSKIFGYFITFLGLGLLAYSFTSLSLSTFSQDKKMQNFQEETKARSESFEKEIQRYNQGVNLGESSLIDPFNYKEADQKYHISENKNLNRKALKDVEGDDFNVDSDAFGYLEIPAINLKRSIYLGASYDHLERGVAHVENTHLPVGGKSTRSVIAGHRGWAGDVMFYDLDELSEGDLVFVYQNGKVLAYIVHDSQIIDPSDWDSLQAVEGEDILTLLTCDPPFPPFDKRLIVNAYRVDNTSLAIAKENSKNPTNNSKKDDVTKKNKSATNTSNYKEKENESTVLETEKEVSLNTDGKTNAQDDSEFYKNNKEKGKPTFVNKLSFVLAIVVWILLISNVYRLIKDIKNSKNKK